MSISDHPPKTVLRPYTPQERQAIHELLQSFLNADEEEVREQQESFELLRKALDEDRPSHRKLFP